MAMNTWAKPGVRCVRVKESTGVVADRGFRGLPTIEVEVVTVCDVMVRGQYGVTISLVEYDPDRRWFQASGFRPLAYPEQSLEHDVALFLNTPARASDLESEGA